MIEFRSLFPAIASAVAALGQGLGVGAAAQSPAFRTITLRDPPIIAEAMSLNTAIDTVMAVAASCHAQSIEAAIACGCAETQNINRLSTVYHQLAASHPDWNRPKTIVSYENPANGHWISLNFSAVSQMLANCGKS